MTDLLCIAFYVFIYPFGLMSDLYFWCEDLICKWFTLGIYKDWCEADLMNLGRS